MITKENIKAIQDRWYATERSPMSYDDAWFMDMEILAEKLLKERDEALSRGDAYRELAIVNHSWVFPSLNMPTCTSDIDSEAAKILEREAKS